jgi:hypothetical protein
VNRGTRDGNGNGRGMEKERGGEERRVKGNEEREEEREGEKDERRKGKVVEMEKKGREGRNNMRKSGPAKSTRSKTNGAPYCTSERNIPRSTLRTREHSDWRPLGLVNLRTHEPSD